MELEGGHLRTVKADLQGWGAVHRPERVDKGNGRSQGPEASPAGQAMKPPSSCLFIIIINIEPGLLVILPSPGIWAILEAYSDQ